MIMVRRKKRRGVGLAVENAKFIDSRPADDGHSMGRLDLLEKRPMKVEESPASVRKLYVVFCRQHMGHISRETSNFHFWLKSNMVYWNAVLK